MRHHVLEASGLGLEVANVGTGKEFNRILCHLGWFPTVTYRNHAHGVGLNWHGVVFVSHEIGNVTMRSQQDFRPVRGHKPRGLAWLLDE